MKRVGASIAGVWVSVALSVSPAFGRTAHAPVSRCCQVAAGTVVSVELVSPVSTKVQKSGDTFALRLAAPLIVDGRVVLRAGTPGVGQVIESAKPGMGGKAAKLVLAARYLRLRGERIPLQSLQLAGAGRDNSNQAQAVGLTGIVFAPLGFVGLAVKGGDVSFSSGTSATAKVTNDLFLPSLGRATRHAMALAAASSSASDASEDAVGSIEIPPPPAGEGQVVFFRRKSLLGTGQWFNVREDGKALGKLTNGAYFVQVTSPGPHKYTATTEPELKDHLRLEVDPGETYFVEGTLTKGVVIGTADISPSDRAAFNTASKDLRPAPPPTEERVENRAAAPADTPPAAPANTSPGAVPSSSPSPTSGPDANTGPATNPSPVTSPDSNSSPSPNAGPSPAQ
jgi:hypothetical protein